MILSAVHSKQWDQRAEQRWRWRKQDRAAPRPQGFIVSMSEWLEPCAGVLGVSASYIRSAFPTPSNRPLRPRLRAYRRVALDFRTTADNIFDLIANFPTHFNHRFCKPKVGSSILSTGTSKNALQHNHFLHFRQSVFSLQKSSKSEFGSIFGSKSQHCTLPTRRARITLQRHASHGHVRGSKHRLRPGHARAGQPAAGAATHRRGALHETV